jgi:hypothetical protein
MIAVTSVPSHCGMGVGVVAHEFKIDEAAAIDPLVRATSSGERVNDEAVPMNRITGAGTLGPSSLSRDNVNPHCVEDLGIVGQDSVSPGSGVMRRLIGASVWLLACPGRRSPFLRSPWRGYT